MGSTHPANQMVGPRTRRNPPPAGKSELAGGTPSKGSGTPTPTPATSRAPTPASAPASASGALGKYTDENLQRATKLALELFVWGQEHGHLQANSAPCNRPLKARNPNLYYGHLHMECYYFCRQCEDHFDMTGAMGPKRVPFAASFLCNRVNFWWQQHKTLEEQNRVDPLTWDKFKAFLRQSLGESTAFVNGIWSRIKRDSQYQQEEVQDWASHLIHLQSVLREFDTRCAPTEEVLCRYFYEGLRPSIRLWIDEEGRELDGWSALVKKATRAEAKAKIQASVSRDTDQYCHRGNRPMHTTAAKANPQSQTTKDSRPEESKVRGPESTVSTAPPRSNSSESSAKARRDKKKDRRRHDQRQRQPEVSNPATGANVAEPGEANKKKNDDRNRSGGATRDMSKVRCYNCNKKGHYSSNCTEPPKN